MALTREDLERLYRPERLRTREVSNEKGGPGCRVVASIDFDSAERMVREGVFVEEDRLVASGDGTYRRERVWVKRTVTWEDLARQWVEAGLLDSPLELL